MNLDELEALALAVTHEGMLKEGLVVIRPDGAIQYPQDKTDQRIMAVSLYRDATGPDVALRLIARIRRLEEVVKELAMDPYDDSEVVSIYVTLQGRARKALEEK